MDGSQFDVWTRRRFGLAASGLSASLLALAGLELEDAAAKKKKRKKKKRKKKKNQCINLGEACDPVDSPPSSCCDCLACGPTLISGENVCCRPGGAPCSAEAPEECCSGQCVSGFCFGKSNGASCSSDRQCFSFNCEANQCASA